MITHPLQEPCPGSTDKWIACRLPPSFDINDHVNKDLDGRSQHSVPHSSSRGRLSAQVKRWYCYKTKILVALHFEILAYPLLNRETVGLREHLTGLRAKTSIRLSSVQGTYINSSRFRIFSSQRLHYLKVSKITLTVLSDRVFPKKITLLFIVDRLALSL